LVNLTPADFNLNDGNVTLAARYAKSRRTKVQPLPGDVSEALAVGKPANAPLWGGTWARDHKGAEMIRLELEVAGIAYADFHSLRYSYLTLGGRSGIDLRTPQEH